MAIVPGSVSLTDANRVLQGATYNRTFTLTQGGSPLNLSSWVGSGKGVRCQFRAEVESATVVCTPTMSIVTPATAGQIQMLIGSDVTTAMTVTNGVYDVELFDTNVSPPLVERVMEGQWSMSLEVTR